MTASDYIHIFSSVATSRKCDGDTICFLVVSSPLRELKFLHSAQRNLARPPTRLPPNPNNVKKKRRHSGGLAQVVRGVLHSVVCNRRQPQQRGMGYSIFMNGRSSRVTVDPRVLTMPGRSMSGFHRPGRHCLHQARSAVRCSASRMKGELHPTNKSLVRRTCIWTTASMS